MSNYLAYNNYTQLLLRIKKLNDIELASFLEEASLKVLTHLDKESFDALFYVKLILEEFVLDFDLMVEQSKGGLLDDEGAMYAIFESVTDVYDGVDFVSFCENYNKYTLKLSDAGLDVEEALRLKSQGKTLKERFKLTDKEALLEKCSVANGGPYANLSFKTAIKRMQDNLKKEVIGQDKAIETASDAFKLFATGFSSHLSLFFAGTTGVGKTELAKQITKEVLGHEKHLLKINCGEYASNHEYAKLIGSPPGYVGHGEKSILRQKSDISDKWVVCFDEIEKANENIYNLLLNLLDEGFILDSTGQKCSFKNSIFIFTSNIGVSDSVGKTLVGFEKKEETTFEGSIEDIKEAINKKFPAEFRNRIDSWVFFNSLTKEDAVEITKKYLKKDKIPVTKNLTDYIVKNSYSTTYGVRNIKRFIRSNILLKVADSILDVGVVNKNKYIFKVKVKDNKVIVTPKEKKEKKDKEKDNSLL
jgi:ATP-dependent Clp protease ATP-binding subunit ClpA